MSHERQSGDETMREHRTVRQLAGTVEAMVAEADPEGRWLDGLCPRLEALREQLTGHFGRESKSYLFEELPAVYPRHRRQIERLEAEHAEILRRLNAAIEQAGAADEPDAASTERLRSKVLALMTTLRRHEAEEDEILVSAYWDDHGGGD